jgi:hypothetical protein
MNLSAARVAILVLGAGDAWVIDYAGDASPQLADNFRVRFSA